MGIDLHRRRSVLVRMSEAGERLDHTRIHNDPMTLATEITKAGEHRQVVLEATYGWYWAVDVLQDAGAEVHLAHPLGVKGFAYRRVKNDVRDAADLADLLRMGRLPEGWIAPPAGACRRGPSTPCWQPPVGPGRRPPAAVPAAGQLTPRELEVLALVARGATNRAVAEALGISAKTVNAHLEHIFAKIGPPAGGLTDTSYLRTYLGAARSITLTQPWNLAGFPALSLPGRHAGAPGRRSARDRAGRRGHPPAPGQPAATGMIGGRATRGRQRVQHRPGTWRHAATCRAAHSAEVEPAVTGLLAAQRAVPVLHMPPPRRAGCWG